MIDFLKKLGRDTRGATAVEYGLILALIFLAMVGAVQALGTESIAMWTEVSSKVTTATGA
ncbi:Flp family type IVb pilin [Qipengyuania marisflavi]|uniref:Flp family type IVb pilin n=2 Tax=Qipengyuania marisflavi TaxID=2486356 RepID=A0A5S3PA90_9SPHN|nr:Flp family type IVb pilin [Qipengyuania marisflavi]TMM50452.1 Flp family type IVb pilin [Qipengyuania marisflavi]